MEIIEVTTLKNGTVRVCLVGGVRFCLYKKEAAAYSLQEGKFLSEEDWQEIRSEILLMRAKKRALYLLQKMDRTEKQLRDKLRETDYPEDIIEEAIDYVSSFHYIDDDRYAANYVHYHQEKKSKTQLKLDLMRRGISSEQIEHAFEEELTVTSEELIKNWLIKKQYDPNHCDDGQRRKLYQFLLRKGFRSEEILHCMRLEEC